MMPRTKALFAAAALFVLGLGVGSLSTAYIGIHKARRALASGEGFGAMQRGLDRFHQELLSELDPSPAQREDLDRQFKELSQNLMDVRRRQSRELLLELRAGGRSLRSTLDEAQRAKYDAIVRRMLLRLGMESRTSAAPGSITP